jgi:hypothetical protein
LAPHYYCSIQDLHLSFEDVTLSENYRILRQALRVDALVHTYNRDRNVYQYDTEWGLALPASDGRSADYQIRNANIEGTIHRAVRLIYYVREGILKGASGWSMFSPISAPGFGILTQDAPDKRFLLYWLYYYFNRHMGQYVLSLDGTAPFYYPNHGLANREDCSGPMAPVLATLSEDQRKIFIIIVNGSWAKAVSCQIHLRKFRPGRSTGILLTSDDIDGNPLLSRKEDAVSTWSFGITTDGIAGTIPPHSVVFFMLSVQ